MKKYVIKKNGRGVEGYVFIINFFPYPGVKTEIGSGIHTDKDFAMVFTKKYLAKALAKAVGGEVEEYHE